MLVSLFYVLGIKHLYKKIFLELMGTILFCLIFYPILLLFLAHTNAMKEGVFI